MAVGKPSGFSDKRIAVCSAHNFGAEHQNSTLAAIAQGVSAGLVVRYLCTGGSILRLRLRNIRFDGKLLWPCILLGTSPALMQLTENLVAISFSTSLQTYGGDMAVASMSILSSVMQFLPEVVRGAQPLLSYNLGAGDISRVKKTFLLPRLWPNAVAGVYLAEPIADTVAVCTTVPMFYTYYRKLK